MKGRSILARASFAFSQPRDSKITDRPEAGALEGCAAKAVRAISNARRTDCELQIAMSKRRFTLSRHATRAHGFVSV